MTRAPVSPGGRTLSPRLRPVRRLALRMMVAAALAAPVAAQAPAPLEVAPASGAILRGLDKVAGAARDIPVAVGDSASFGRLTLTVLECRYPVGNPSGDGYAYVVIHDARAQEAVFRGWMIAASPALNALDHPRFDVWLMRCTNA